MLQSFKSLIILLALSGLVTFGFRKLLSPAGATLLHDRIGIFVLACFASVFLAPHVLVTLGVCLVLVPMFARTAREAANLTLVAAFILPMIKLTIAPGGSLIAILTPSMMVGIGGLVASFRERAERGTGFSLPILLLIAITVLWNARDLQFFSIARSVVDAVLIIVVLYIVIVRALRTPDDLKAMLLHLSYASVLLSSVLLFESFRHWPLFPDTVQRLSEGGYMMVKMRGGMLRASGPIIEPMQAAMVMLMMAVGTIGSRSSFRSTPVWLLAIAVGLAGVMMPQSRNAIGGFGVAVLVFMFYRGQIGKSVALGAAAAVFFMIAQFATGRNPIPFMNEDVAEGGGDVSYRAELLTRGLEEFWKAPLFGAPSTDVLFRLRDMVQGEGIVDFVNTYLHIGLLTGFIGLFIFCSALAVTLLQLLVGRKRVADDDVRSNYAAVTGAVVALVAMLALTSMQTYVTLLLTMWLGVAAAMKAVSASRLEAEPVGDAVPKPRSGVGGAASPISLAGPQPTGFSDLPSIQRG